MSAIIYNDLQFTDWKPTNKPLVKEKIAEGTFIDGSKWKVIKRKKSIQGVGRVTWSVEISDKHDLYIDHITKVGLEEMLKFLNEQRVAAKVAYKLLHNVK